MLELFFCCSSYIRNSSISSGVAVPFFILFLICAIRVIRAGRGGADGRFRCFTSRRYFA